MGTSLPPKSLSVLFRNNHFYTLYKHTFPPRESVSLTVQLSNWIGFDETDRANHQYELLTLVTDQGYQKDDQIIWETLSNMEGDSIFLKYLNSVN